MRHFIVLHQEEYIKKIHLCVGCVTCIRHVVTPLPETVVQICCTLWMCKVDSLILPKRVLNNNNDSPLVYHSKAFAYLIFKRLPRLYIPWFFTLITVHCSPPSVKVGIPHYPNYNSPEILRSTPLRDIPVSVLVFCETQSIRGYTYSQRRGNISFVV